MTNNGTDKVPVEEAPARPRDHWERELLDQALKDLRHPWPLDEKEPPIIAL